MNIAYGQTLDVSKGLCRYFINLLFVFPFLFMAASGAHIMYYNYAPIKLFIDYEDLTTLEPVYNGHDIRNVSTSFLGLDSRIVWYDSLWCTDKAGTNTKIGTQEWPDFEEAHPMERREIWLMNEHHAPDWASTCNIEGHACLTLPFNIFRCSEPYRSQNVSITKYDSRL